MKLRWKILIAVGLGILASYLFGAAPPKPYNLQSDFNSYNEEYFYNALPHNTTVIWVDLSAYADYGRIDTRPDGTMLISIDPKMNPGIEEAKMTLFHEMCHEKIGLHINIPIGLTKQAALDGFGGHGPAHEACMVDLAQRGAFHGLW